MSAAGLVVTLALALGIVSLVLIAAGAALAWSMFSVVRRELGALLEEAVVKMRSATTLFEQLRQAEEELRPVVLAARAQPRAVEPPPEFSTAGGVTAGEPVRATMEPRANQPGIAPVPQWILDGIEAKRRREEWEATLPTDAVVPRPPSWDFDPNMREDGERTEQEITPARDSKLRAEPPG